MLQILRSIAFANVTTIFDIQKRTGVTWRDGSHSEIGRCEEELTTVPETICHVRHKFPVVKNVFDRFAADDYVKLPLKVAPLIQFANVLDLKFGKIRTAYRSALARLRLIERIPTQT